MEVFLRSLSDIDNDSDLLDFTRKKLLHGTPYVFRESVDNYYEFRKRISTNFDISFNEVFITGSGHLGFSPHKKTIFSYESDIDVAIVSPKLYEDIMEQVRQFQMKLRKARISVHKQEIDKYHSFLEYSAMGWMRPDLLPTRFTTKAIRKSWFEYFKSISYGKSEVGNYKVSAGVFKSYYHLEQYTFSGLKSVKNTLGLLNNE